MIRGFGDSNAAGYGVSAAKTFIGLFTPINSGVSASQASEVSSAVQQEVPQQKLYLVNVGLNDLTRYKNDAAKKEFFKRGVRAVVGWLSLVDKKTARGAQAGITFTGMWADSPAPNTCGKYTIQNGATATAIVSGTSVFIGVSEGDYVDMGENINVNIDGVDKGTFSVKQVGVTTWLNQWWGRTCWKFDGLTAGPHTVVITQNSPNGKFLHVDWIAGSDQTRFSDVRVNNLGKCSSTWMNAAGATEAVFQEYNSIISSVVSEFPNAKLIDVYNTINPAIHLQADGAHFNEAGHLAIHNLIMSE